MKVASEITQVVQEINESCGIVGRLDACEKHGHYRRDERYDPAEEMVRIGEE